MAILRFIATFSTVLTLLLAVYYQLILKELLVHAGYWRTVEALNNQQCISIPELQACKKTVLHRPSGLLYLACSTPSSRLGRFNASARLLEDYIAVYDSVTSRITRLNITGFPTSVPLALHGFDVVQSNDDPSELFVFVINHRPLDENTAKYGANSVVEIFKTRTGGGDLLYLATVEDPSVMISPNDLVGYGDGISFYFTNDNKSKRGFMRAVDHYLRLPGKTVGYCRVHWGCKFAATGLRGASGIARDNAGQYFVTNGAFGEISVFETQDDESLVLTDILKTDRPMDGISVDDEDDVLHIAAFPKTLGYPMWTSKDYIMPLSSSVFRLSRNTGSGQFYGEKYKIDKVFEDDGNVASAVTSAVWDPPRGVLYLSGISSPGLFICKIDNIAQAPKDNSDRH